MTVKIFLELNTIHGQARYRAGDAARDRMTEGDVTLAMTEAIRAEAQARGLVVLVIGPPDFDAVFALHTLDFQLCIPSDEARARAWLDERKAKRDALTNSQGHEPTMEDVLKDLADVVEEDLATEWTTNLARRLEAGEVGPDIPFMVYPLPPHHDPHTDGLPYTPERCTCAERREGDCPWCEEAIAAHEAREDHDPPE